MRVEVVETDGTVVTTKVIVGGPVSNNKGINLPGVAVNVPALSEKDEADLRWGLRIGADLIALSFVRSAKDVQRVHVIMAEEGRHVPVIAKIEKPQAVDNLEEIIDAFDGIMVARGDLGVELPLEAVPIVQKRAVELCRRMAKPVIVATQMLESMIDNPVPTRAETSDVANAVLDGADAVMLSGETSVGKYPVVVVETMARIVDSTEEHGLERIAPLTTKPRTQGGAITLAAMEVAEFVEAKYLCIFTESGDTARRMSRLRPQHPDDRLHARAGDPSPHGADVGRAVDARRARRAHRPHVHPGRRLPARQRPREGRRQGRRDLGIPSRNHRLDERHPHPQGRRRRARQGADLPVRRVARRTHRGTVALARLSATVL